ncbi:PREDICTED: peroxisomal and mitochondrial division factor 2-like [Camelina sativa]|uniref:Peroxisomal and mitochondrial division factor 2-like n=1 Tax=Camelina sativa TaxID=90675 RepID=A0ABM0WS52_CAMSA|nr:PREDICTED: peroxisomal and mitochondrial division factor 2-like [Camelina sativa]
MAEERTLNGEATSQEDESFFDSDHQDGVGNKSTELNRKIGELESQNQELVRDNGEISKKIESLTAEIEELRAAESKAKRKMGEMEREIDKSDEERKVLEAIAARASELETEVARVQHELITAKTEGEEATAEAKKLQSEISQKGVGIVELEKEVAGLRIVKEENEKRMKELETKLGALEVKELEERNKKVRAEEEMREKIGNKDKEMDDLKERIKGLESDVAKGKAELQKWITEKMVVEEALRDSEKKVVAMESEIVELQKQMDDAEKMISGLKNVVEPVNGIELKSWSPTVSAGSGGAVAAVAVAVAGVAVVCYVLHSRRV